VLFAGLLTLTSCERGTPAQQRARHLADAEGEVVVAVAWPLKLGKASLSQGVDLAVEEINRSGGMLGGRRLKILYKDDASSLSKGRLVAQEIADNLDVAAVIGHLNTYITAPASQIYERAGVLMITPGASGQKITDRGAQLAGQPRPGPPDRRLCGRPGLQERSDLLHQERLWHRPGELFRAAGARTGHHDRRPPFLQHGGR
jgi:branched-chain amino acid transport system substrate-binding protein